MLIRSTLSKLAAPFLAAVFLSLAWPGLTADLVTYRAIPNKSKMRMDGDSTIHKWHAETAIIGGFLELEAGFLDGSGKSAPAVIKPNVEVRIPVRTLKSSGGKRMDAVMLKHMKFDKHKVITYKVIELSPNTDTGSGDAGAVSGSIARFNAKGALKVAGVTRTNTMAVTIARIEDSRLKVSGTTTLKMTDFGINPPNPDVGLGLIKTDNEVKLKFEWVTKPKAK